MQYKIVEEVEEINILKLAIQLKLAMYCRGCPQSRAV